MILEIYKAVGNKIRQSFIGLRQAQIEHLEEGFNQIDGVSPEEAKARQSVSPPKESSKAGGIKPGSQAKKTRTGKKDEEFKCQFCNKFDKTFEKTENLDLHFWKDCVMLTECKHCSQVIEIETYN